MSGPIRPVKPGRASRGISEFGELLGDLVERIPGAEAAVISDRGGYPVDFAVVRERTSELDIQLAGAQIGQTMNRLRVRSGIHGLDQLVVLVECSRASLVAAPLDQEFLLTVALSRTASLALALSEVAGVREVLCSLLR